MYEFDPLFGTSGTAVEEEEMPLAYVSSYKCEDCGTEACIGTCFCCATLL